MKRTGNGAQGAGAFLGRIVRGFLAVAFCAVGLAAVAADSVTYLEWNETTKQMEEKSVTDYTLVTADTATFDAGKTYVVQGEVVRDKAIMVNGTADSPTYLILCDGAKLTVTTTGGGTVSALGNDDPGIGVKSDRALVICGQTQGTGVLDARGGRWGAGIGGRHSEAGGTVTINGGTIIAIGGGPAINPGETDPSHGGGAGIGGGYEGKGGTVTINGGMVTAIGTAGHAMAGARACAAGIGAGGTDKVSLKDPGTLTFGSGFSGFVLAGENETCPVMMTPAEYSADHGSKYRYVKMPVADVSVPQVAGVTYVVSNGANKVSGAVVGTGEASTNHYAALPGDTLKVYFVLREGSSYKRPPAQNPMEIVVSGWQQSVSLAELPEVEATSVSYLDWDEAQQQLVPKTICNYEFVTPDMDVLEAGKTYVVKGAVTNATDGIVVYGVDKRPTTLVLCDDASLTVRGGQYLAGIAVAGVRGRDFIDHVLVICGQENGTGVLDAMGGENAAGIGGNYIHFISPTEGTCAYVACGTVTINGGVVKATGGNTAAGIGGGSGDGAASLVGTLSEVADGGTVTINGGVVTATGGNYAAGIGGGIEGGGGTVTINGGTVAATGGAEGAGIGGGRWGAPGTVTFGPDFGDADTDGVRAGASEETAVYMPKAKYSEDHSARFVTLPEPEPVEVTIKLPKAKNCAYVVSNLTAGVEGEIFPTEEGGLSYVLPVHKKVAIYVIPDQGYRIVGENPYVIEDVKYDETIPSGVLPNAEQVPASATLVSVSPRYPWNGKVDVTVDLLNAHENNSYALALAFTANDETVCVTNNLDNAAEGHNTVTVDCAGLFPADTVAADAHVEVKLIDVAAPEGEEITPFCVTAEEPNLMVGFFDNRAAFSASFGFDFGSWSCNNLEYSFDGGTWQPLESEDGDASYYVTLTNVGDKVYFRGNNPNGFSSLDFMEETGAIGTLFAYSEEKEGNGMVSVSGNIMSLVDLTMEATAIPDGSGCFAGLFTSKGGLGCILLSADRLLLPATTLKPACYLDMFDGQTYLTGAPELPAEELEPMCYAMMFSGCSSLRYVKMMATDIGSTDDGCLSFWLEDAGKQSGAPIPVSGATLARNPDAEWDSSLAEVPAGWTVKSFGGTAPQLMAAPRPVLSASAGEPVVTLVGEEDFALDLRNERTIYTGSIENFTYSATGWGEEGAGESAAITYTVDGGAPQTLAEGLTDAGTVNWNPAAVGTYVFTHTSGEAVATATFIVEAAPKTITLPTGVAGYTYVVSNLTDGAEGEIPSSGSTDGGATYELPIGAHVAIYCIPAGGYAVSGTNPYDIPSVTADTTFNSSDLPRGVKVVSVTVSRIQQRYPWNGKVDIDYTVAGVADPDDCYIRFTVFTNADDSASGFVARAFDDDSRLARASNGTYRATWDSLAEVKFFLATNASIKADLVYDTGNAGDRSPYATEFMVIDLANSTATTDYSVSYETFYGEKAMERTKTVYNTDEYKTNKIVLRRIRRGIFTAGSPTTETGRIPASWAMGETQHETTLTKDFYIGVFELTQGQYKKVMAGANPSYWTSDTMPVEQVTYQTIRGTSLGMAVPIDGRVDELSFMGQLRKKTGLDDFDLPTEHQFEYASRAGTTESTYFGNNVDQATLNTYTWNVNNSSSSSMHQVVGGKDPNPWGLYDMLGNCWEWSRDRVATAGKGGNDYTTAVVDPLLQASGGTVAVRGSCAAGGATELRSACRAGLSSDTVSRHYGFRLYCAADEVLGGDAVDSVTVSKLCLDTRRDAVKTVRSFSEVFAFAWNDSDVWAKGGDGSGARVALVPMSGGGADPSAWTVAGSEQTLVDSTGEGVEDWANPHAGRYRMTLSAATGTERETAYFDLTNLKVWDELETIFDTAHTATTVEPVYDASGNLAGHKVILGQNYDGGVALSNDFGAVTIDLNGWTISGTNGTDGSTTTAGTAGGAAITVAGTCGADEGATAITVTNTAAAGSAAAIVGGKGGEGNPAGKGAFAFADSTGAEVAVTDPLGLVAKGADGVFLKSKAQEDLEKIFDVEHTPTMVKPEYDASGVLAGHKVILGQDYGPVALSNDFGAVTIDLNGWTIAGTNGVDGTAAPGGDGGAAITVAGTSGAGMGDTAITVKDDSCVQLWADGPYFSTRNVGAKKPQEYGYYFWWGDTVGYVRNSSNNGWDAVDGSVTGFEFSGSNDKIETNGKSIQQLYDNGNGYIDANSTDGKLKPEHDAATVHWGAPWRMPTKAELDKLVSSSVCVWTWTSDWKGTGEAGYVVKGKGDYASNNVFFPAAGVGNDSSLNYLGSYGHCWTSLPVSDSANANYFSFGENNKFKASIYSRCGGLSVRAVRGAADTNRPVSGPAAAIVGGNGGDGCPPGRGAFGIVDENGNEYPVAGRSDLIVRGDVGRTGAMVYDAIGGAFSDGSETMVVATSSGRYAFPSEPVRTGYAFVGWFDGISSTANAVSSGALVAVGQMKVFAKWRSEAVEPGVASGEGVLTDDGLAVTEFKPTAAFTAELRIPERTANDAESPAIVSIARNAFTPRLYEKALGAPAPTAVSIPAFVTEIHNNAFFGCSTLTNVTFVPARDYRTGEIAELYVRNSAFDGTAVTNLVFPAGGKYRLGYYAFANNPQLKDVWILGEITLDSYDKSPFREIGEACGGTTFHLSPAAMADAKLVCALTNGLHMVQVRESEPTSSVSDKPIGQVAVSDFSVGGDVLTVDFTLSADAPWKTVTAETVSLLYSNDPMKLVVGDCRRLSPTEVTDNGGGSYTAKFAKPEGATGFFSVCVSE